MIACPKCDREVPSLAALDKHLRRYHNLMGRELVNILDTFREEHGTDLDHEIVAYNKMVAAGIIQTL